MEKWTDDTGQHIIVHDRARCSGQFCCVHNPSQHGMVGFARHWRSDRKIMERICPHGIGHPDPDDVAFRASIGDTNNAHGCDGCCSLGQVKVSSGAIKLDLSGNDKPKAEIQVLQNLIVHVYEKPGAQNNWVVEVETADDGIETDLPHVAHSSGEPCLKVMVNEAVVSDDTENADG